MSKVTFEFKFEIGQIVYYRAAEHNYDNTPKQFTVYERHGQQCHGGEQMLYRICGRSELIVEVVLTGEMPAYKVGDAARPQEDRERRIAIQPEWMGKTAKGVRE